MPKIIVDITTDENGYFGKTIAFTAPDTPAATISVSATLLSPFATALHGNIRVERKGATFGHASRETREFLLWHSETMQLGSWPIAHGDNIIVIHGKTNPPRANSRLVLEVDATA